MQEVLFSDACHFGGSRARCSHDAKDIASDASRKLKGGKRAKRTIPRVDVDFVRNHIASFPRVPANYCRASPAREYLDEGLSLAKMFDLYVGQCHEHNREPVKLRKYREIFTTEFNLAFQMPKKDQCSAFCEFENTVAPSQLALDEHKRHDADKIVTRLEKQKDKTAMQPDIGVLCCDMERCFNYLAVT